MSDTLEATLSALADPTRRRIIETLAHGRLSAGELAAHLDVTPAVLTRHLRVLRDDRLVVASLDEADHRRHIYALRPEPLIQVRGWVDDLAGFWQGQLDAFAAHADHENRRSRG